MDRNNTAIDPLSPVAVVYDAMGDRHPQTMSAGVLAVMDEADIRCAYQGERLREFQEARATVADVLNGLYVAVSSLETLDPSHPLLPNMRAALARANGGKS